MKLGSLFYLSLIALGLSGGQILFKLVGRSVANADSLIRGLLSPYLVAALVLYGIITLLWIWQLSVIDLSRAYPVMALTFVIVPICSMMLLGETMYLRDWIGAAFIVGGILIMHAKF